MKRTILTCAVASLLTLLPASVMTAQSTTTDSLKTDTLSFSMKSDKAECTVKIEFPTEHDSQLTQNVMRVMGKTLGVEASKSTDSPTKLLSEEGLKSFEELYKTALEDADMGAAAAFPYITDTKVSKTFESSKVVTFTVETYCYLGGAHGSWGCTPMTFVKPDGKEIGFNIFTSTDNREFRTLLIRGLKQYFEVKTDRELKGMLLDISNLNDIPLPQTAPYFSKNGIELIYQQYEIAPYAAGAPVVVIPYDMAKPLLTAEAATLIE